ncbi:MAG: putative sporulation protein YtxC [Pelosinus sp.]|nr:putative sporulation protein YtxC [Pelosinus sp.]
MKLVAVGLQMAVDELKEKMQAYCKVLAEQGFAISIDEVKKGNYIFLSYSIIEGDLSFRNYERIKSLLKKFLADTITTIILTYAEKDIINKIIENNYNYLSDKEKQLVYDNSINALKANDADYNERFYYISQEIISYFETHHEIVVEGFIHFRLQEYRSKLLDIINDIVEHLMKDLEYKEFIRVLKYFVDIQETKIEEVHIIVDASGNFKILDAAGKVLTDQYAETFFLRSEEDFNCEDMIITALISIAPYNIVLHAAAVFEESILKTINLIFDDRVVKCSGCEICKKEIAELSPFPK